MPTPSELLHEQGYGFSLAERASLYEELGRDLGDAAEVYTATDLQEQKLAAALAMDLLVPRLLVSSKTVDTGDPIAARATGPAVVRSHLAEESIEFHVPGEQRSLGSAAVGIFPIVLFSDRGVREGVLEVFPDLAANNRCIPVFVDSADSKSLTERIVDEVGAAVDELEVAVKHFIESVHFDFENLDAHFFKAAVTLTLTADFLFKNGVDLSLMFGSCSLSVAGLAPIAGFTCFKTGGSLALGTAVDLLGSYAKVLGANIGTPGMTLTERDVELLGFTFETIKHVKAGMSLASSIRKVRTAGFCASPDFLKASEDFLGSDFVQMPIESPAGKALLATLQIMVTQGKTVSIILCGSENKK